MSEAWHRGAATFLRGCLAAWLAFASASSSQAAAPLVEVILFAPRDDARGYCLDVVGHSQRAAPERGLQAHSCYSYRGKLESDQAFDATRIPLGEFRVPAFERCMEPEALKQGAALELRPCDSGSAQRFDIKPDGSIRPQAAPDLCLTVMAGAARAGGGGNPAHLIRRLTLEPCAASRTIHQRWRLRAQAD